LTSAQPPESSSGAKFTSPWSHQARQLYIHRTNAVVARVVAADDILEGLQSDAAAALLQDVHQSCLEHPNLVLRTKALVGDEDGGGLGLTDKDWDELKSVPAVGHRLSFRLQFLEKLAVDRGIAATIIGDLGDSRFVLDVSSPHELVQLPPVAYAKVVAGMNPDPKFAGPPYQRSVLSPPKWRALCELRDKSIAAPSAFTIHAQPLTGIQAVVTKAEWNSAEYARTQVALARNEVWDVALTFQRQAATCDLLTSMGVKVTDQLKSLGNRAWLKIDDMSRLMEADVRSNPEFDTRVEKMRLYEAITTVDPARSAIDRDLAALEVGL